MSPTPSTAHAKPASRSEFIDLTAWGFLGLGVFAALLGAGQLIYLVALIPIGQITQVTHEMAQTLAWPGWARTLVKYLPQWLVALTVLSLFTVWASLGLLKRREWARMTFVVMMWAGVAANLVGAVLPFYVDLSPAPMIATLPPEWRDLFGAMLTSSAGAFAWTAALSALVFAGLFAWTAIILQSKKVRQEFGAP
jgi:type IV secretory pathway VirB2 component (pilin)